MTWIIEGARQVIEMGFKIPLPTCVQQAIKAYREQNDWLGHFLADRCEVGAGFQEKSGEIYAAYRAYCTETNEYSRSTSDFYAALEGEGMTRARTRTGTLIRGLRLTHAERSTPDEDFPDFLK